MEPWHKISVLDHGYVIFVDSMGSDEAIVEAARMSTGRGFVSWEAYKRCKRCDDVTLVARDGSLIGLFAEVRGGGGSGSFNPPMTVLREGCRYRQECGQGGEHDWQDFPRGDLAMLEFMYKNKHSTPFEFGELHIEVQAPLMVFREWHRHRTQAYSEFSARYSQMPDLHYLPALDRVQMQSQANRQGSGEALKPGEAQRVVYRMRDQQVDIYDYYDELVKDGVAKEIARLNTPVSRYSKMRAKTDLRNWLAFLMLRMSPNAQYEIRMYANAVAEIVKAVWPRTFALFEEHDLHGVHLSRSEAAALAPNVSSNTLAVQLGEKTAVALLKKLGG